jgi:hypothetical protein
LIELIILAGAIIGLGHAIRPEDPFLLDFHPHPLWLPVLLIAVRYGQPLGTIAGLLCAGLHLLGLSVRGLAVEEAFHLDPLALLVPALYVVVGTVIAEWTGSRPYREQYFRQRIQELHERLKASEARRGEMEMAYRQVEGRVAGQANTFISLYESAARLDSLQSEEIYAGLLAILRQYLGVEEAGVWVVDARGELKRVAPEGRAGGALPPIGRAVLRTASVVTVRDMASRTGAPAPGGLMAGPLRAGDQKVEAIVVVESMSFVGFTRTAEKLFQLLLDWTSRSLATARRLEEAQRRDVQEARLDLRSETYLRSRAEEEIALAVRRGSDLALLACRMPPALAEETRERLQIVLARIFRRLTRVSDVVAYFEDASAFVLLLPDVDAERVKVVRTKLTGAVEGFGFEVGPGRTPLVLEWGEAARREEKSLDPFLGRALAELGGGA